MQSQSFELTSKWCIGGGKGEVTSNKLLITVHYIWKPLTSAISFPSSPVTATIPKVGFVNFGAANLQITHDSHPGHGYLIW
jgi:hypothetical protein